jgi:hypothetical protein
MARSRPIPGCVWVAFPDASSTRAVDLLDDVQPSATGGHELPAVQSTHVFDKLKEEPDVRVPNAAHEPRRRSRREVRLRRISHRHERRSKHDGVLQHETPGTGDISATIALPTVATWGSQGCTASISPNSTITNPSACAKGYVRFAYATRGWPAPPLLPGSCAPDSGGDRHRRSA